MNRILITFGGVDPNNYTQKVLETVYDFCLNHNIAIDVITGLGYKQEDSLASFSAINLYTDVKNISDYMLTADITFTSGGRTAYEIAALGIPSIVLCQNERELTHFFAREEFGFVNLGLGYDVANRDLLYTFNTMVDDFEMRTQAHTLMLKQDIESGKYRVINLIKEIINNKSSEKDKVNDFILEQEQ